MPTPKTKRPPETPAAVPARPTLDPFQLMLTDLFTELVTHGDSDSADVENLLYALFSAQQARRRGASEDAMKYWKDRGKQDWLRRFRNARAALPAVESQKKMQQSLTEEVLQNRRDALIAEFRGFTQSATAAEVFFLWDVLSTWTSTRCGFDGDAGELYIASAFNWVLSRPGWFFYVPEWANEAVEEHLKWLTEQREKLIDAA